MRRTIIFLLAGIAALSAISSCGHKYTFDLDNNLGICGIGWAETAQQCGINYLEAGVSSFLIPEKSDEEFAHNKAQALSSSLPYYSANGFFPGEIKIVGPEADHPRAIRYSQVAIRRASEIGMKILVLGSSGSRRIPEGFTKEEAEKQFVDFLKAVAPTAEKYGVIVAIEPLQKSESNFINTVREGAALARRTGSPNICVIADLYHMARENEGPDAIIDSADKLVHCHIAEAEKRTAPGVMGDDFTPYLSALKQIKYTGRMSMECGWRDISAQLPVAVKTLKDQINSVK